MLRQSLIAAVCACFHPLDATGRRTDTRTTQHRTIAHRVYTYDPVPNASYSPNYGPTYPTAYVTATLVTSLPGAAVCLAFSLMGGC